MRTIRRCIPKAENPNNRNYYLVDANFLVNNYLAASQVHSPDEKRRILRAKAYWKEIESQLKSEKARVYILDLCIAEAFRVLAKKYYNNEDIFKNYSSYKYAQEKLRKALQLSSVDARKPTRKIKYHDIQTNRDIIISVDRFFEKACKMKYIDDKNVSIIDLMVLATAKYLVDFYGISNDKLFVITQDAPLSELAKSYQDLPAVFNPSEDADEAYKVFV